MAILIVEDDPDLLAVVSFTLRRDGYEVIEARDGPAGLQLWKAEEPNLVLLDVDSPHANGWDVCKQIRGESATPVIVLTTSHKDVDMVRGFDLGADDYLAKPFSPAVLSSRVRAVLRRSVAAPTQPPRDWGVTTAGDLTLDPQWRSVLRGGQPVRLTPMEFKLLHVLMLHEGQVLTHQALTDRVWGSKGVDAPGLLKSQVSHLRRRLGEDPANPVYILTVAGIGYTFRRRVDAY